MYTVCKNLHMLGEYAQLFLNAIADTGLGVKHHPHSPLSRGQHLVQESLDFLILWDVGTTPSALDRSCCSQGEILCKEN